MEAEGTFGIKGISPYLQVGQHMRNLHVLKPIPDGPGYAPATPGPYKFF